MSGLFRWPAQCHQIPTLLVFKGTGQPNALKSEYSPVQREKPASHNDPTVQPGDQLSAWNDAASSFHGDKICRPRALPSVRVLAVTAALGVALRCCGGPPELCLVNFGRPHPSQRLKAQAIQRPRSGFHSSHKTWRRSRKASPSSPVRSSSRVPASRYCRRASRSFGNGRLPPIPIGIPSRLEIRRCDPPRSLGIATANGRRPGGRQGSRRPKTRGEPSPAAGGAAAVTPIRCGGCGALAPPGSQPGPPPPFP